MERQYLQPHERLGMFLLLKISLTTKRKISMLGHGILSIARFLFGGVTEPVHHSYIRLIPRPQRILVHFRYLAQDILHMC